MKAILVLMTVIASFTSNLVIAAPNFECDIFSKDSATGKFSMKGENPETQAYTLKFSEGPGAQKKFTGDLYLKGMMPFTELELETQKDIMNAMRSSRRAHLKTGPMVVYGNANGSETSTMNVYLMPSGEIAYLQIGFVEAFCM